MVFEGLKLAIW